MGSPSQANYSYGQQHGPDYGHSYPHQTQHGQGYGHGYTDVKYDHHMAPQNQYGGHGPSQPTSYPQSGAHPSYGTHEQYGKPPSYGMHPQASQPYSHPRANQPGDVPYQGPVPSTQGYGASMLHQQQYPSIGQVQQTYPTYGSSTAADGYNHPQGAPASGPGYPQQSAQPIPGYGQPVPQQPLTYAQAAPVGGYSSYPSQPTYTEQQATNNAGYGYQGPVDQTYSGAQASTTHSAPFSGLQAYAQPAPVPSSAPAQPGYDQSMTQPGGGYAPVPAAGYVKSVSPQPGYAPQYDANQMYGAPR
uniref:Nucleic acid binding protein n=1 Tax=Solanum tuberosum TaxID=4113 RepID=M1AV71_SOLTU